MRNPESRDSSHSAAIPIWVGAEFIPANVRLIKGDNELIGMEVICELLLIVDFERRYVQVAQAEWQVVIRNVGDRLVFRLRQRRVVMQNRRSMLRKLKSRN